MITVNDLQIGEVSFVGMPELDTNETTYATHPTRKPPFTHPIVRTKQGFEYIREDEIRDYTHAFPGANKLLLWLKQNEKDILECMQENSIPVMSLGGDTVGYWEDRKQKYLVDKWEEEHMYKNTILIKNRMQIGDMLEGQMGYGLATYGDNEPLYRMVWPDKGGSPNLIVRTKKGYKHISESEIDDYEKIFAEKKRLEQEKLQAKLAREHKYRFVPMSLWFLSVGYIVGFLWWLF